MQCTKERCRPRSVFDEFDRGLNQFVRGVLSTESNLSSTLSLTLIELEDRYRIECDLPGIELEDISLAVEDGILSLAGLRKAIELPESAKVMLNERPAREFSRSVRLPKNADVGNVDAELQNGVLTVTVLKRSEVLPKKIQIRRSGAES